MKVEGEPIDKIKIKESSWTMDQNRVLDINKIIIYRHGNVCQNPLVFITSINIYN